MKYNIFTKVLAQLFLGLTFSILYMQIRPYENYTLQWPFSFIAVWYLLWAWIAYLKYDRLSVFKVTERYKKQINESNAKYEQNYFTQKTPGFMNYVYTPIKANDSEQTKTEILKTRMIANFICFVVFIVSSFFF